jgi:tetratricopeptide (TPR) repeat protein
VPTFSSSTATQPGNRALDALACLAIGLVLVVGPQMLGGVYPWAMFALAGGSLLTLTLAAAANLDLRPTASCWAIFAAVLWTAIQALPLPSPIAQLLAPESLDQLRRSRALVGLDAPSFCAISRDPAGTREEIIKGIAVAAAFVTALSLSRQGYRRWVYGMVAASGIAMALVALVHAVLGATRVFGVYTPVQIRDPLFVAPLLNLNTLGGFLAMCVPLMTGLSLSSRDARARALWLLGIALLASCTFMTRSRGAIGVLLVGPVLMAVLAWRVRAGRSRRQGSLRKALERFAVPLGVLVGIGVAAYGWYAEAIHEFRNGGLDKIDLIAHGAAFALRHPLLGVGRGAFGSVFAAAHGANNRFVYAENFVVQWAAEWGLPVTLLLLAALSRELLVAARDTRSVERLGALAAIAVICAQNLVDIGFEMLGVSVVVAALLGATLAERRSRRAPTRVRAQLWWKHPAFGCAAASAVLIALLSTGVHRDFGQYLKAQLEAQLAARDRKDFSLILAEALIAHPSEAVFPTLAGTEALRNRDRRAGAFINRAMQLAPRWPGPHLLAAQGLWNSGRARQALLELRLAASADAYGSRTLLCPIARVDPRGVADVVARGEYRSLILELSVECVLDTPWAASQFDAILMLEHPKDPQPWVREARRRMAAGEAEPALEAAEAARQRAPTQAADALEVSAEALAALGRTDEALTALREAQRQAPESRPLVAQEATLLGQKGDRAGMRAAFDHLRGLSDGQAAEVARAFLLQAAHEERFGDTGAALHAYEQAYRIADDTDALRQIARIADRIGERRQAAWAYTQLCNLGGDDQRACAKRDSLLQGNPQLESSANAAQPSQK